MERALDTFGVTSVTRCLGLFESVRGSDLILQLLRNFLNGSCVFVYLKEEKKVRRTNDSHQLDTREKRERKWN